MRRKTRASSTPTTNAIERLIGTALEITEFLFVKLDPGVVLGLGVISAEAEAIVVRWVVPVVFLEG